MQRRRARYGPAFANPYGVGFGKRNAGGNLHAGGHRYAARRDPITHTHGHHDADPGPNLGSHPSPHAEQRSAIPIPIADSHSDANGNSDTDHGCNSDTDCNAGADASRDRPMHRLGDRREYQCGAEIDRRCRGALPGSRLHPQQDGVV